MVQDGLYSGQGTTLSRQRSRVQPIERKMNTLSKKNWHPDSDDDRAFEVEHEPLTFEAQHQI
ncbi:hypothetical protein ACRALDRAFT_206092 [Sodiomyces alcalophilus JCM 7366]|uniref:uncharacterized protein n=1 Tax=Sodiomyces alcalophilus JCM 7366 TaxID=591952 RepID=UPI0039B52C37